jgi:hypothetical protein
MPDYFTKNTDEHIVLFNLCEDKCEKNKIFERGIKGAFDKLIENLIYVYGYYAIEDTDTLKMECMSVLYEMLPKYNAALGTKGFSYFNVVAKNWFIHKLREKSKKNKLENELVANIETEAAKYDISFIVQPHEDIVEERERWLELSEEIEEWKIVLKKKAEHQILEAILFLLRNPDIINNYPLNKKAVYLYLREMTGLNTKQVVLNLKRIKELYDDWNMRFNRTCGLPIFLLD